VIELPEDFRDLLISLADEGAEFAVVGGHAVAFHGHPRATKDLDILVRTTPQNAERVYRALVAFGAPVQAFDVKVEDFAKYEGVLQIGVAPLRIDILTSISGVSTGIALKDCDVFELEGRAIPVIGLPALLANKRATGREQDRADVATLERLHPESR
jgi:predicted nucleotidyltransferase